MFRRSALGIAVAFSGLTRPAAAQTAPTQATPGARAAPVPGADSRMMVVIDSVFSTLISDLAGERAENPLVKFFAGFEAAEQRSVLQAMRAGGLPVPDTVPMPPEKMQLVQQLQALRGRAFDNQYLVDQLLVHRELMWAQQDLLGVGVPAEKVIATLAIPSIEQHIAMIAGLREHLAGAPLPP